MNGVRMIWICPVGTLARPILGSQNIPILPLSCVMRAVIHFPLRISN